MAHGLDLHLDHRPFGLLGVHVGADGEDVGPRDAFPGQ
jgi:hypothetical protein